MLLINNNSINNNDNNCLLLAFLCSYYVTSEYYHIFVTGLSDPQFFLSDWFTLFLLCLPSLNTRSPCPPHTLSLSTMLHCAQYKIQLLSLVFQSLSLSLSPGSFSTALQGRTLWFSPLAHSLIPK